MEHNKSIQADKSTAAVKVEQSSDSKGVTPRRRINVRMVQNSLLIWLDKNIDDNSVDCQNTITQLRCVVNIINTFTDDDECIQFLDSMGNEKACMIISGSLGQQIVPRIHNMSQVDSIFIFCDDKKYHEQWTKEWTKIKGVFTEISPICEALKQTAQEHEQNATSMSFIATSGDNSKKNLDQLDPSFMYTQIMKEILLTIDFEPKHFTEYINYCCEVFDGNRRELNNVNKLQRNYRDHTPIWWYTYDCFLYSMLNRSLRFIDVNIIIKMGFFIGDLHRHIYQLHQEQFGDNHSDNSFIVYRGQGMSKTDFEQMSKTKGGLISFNNFLSTSKHRKVSLDFANRAVTNPDLVGTLFVMTIDPSKSTTPFASINDVSYYKAKEDEVLFAMNTVSRISEIKPMDENHHLFQVELTLTSDNDKDLRILTDHIRKETSPDAKGWHRLGFVLLKMGESDKAEEIYENLLEQATEESEKAPIYHQIGWANDILGKYKGATTFYEKSLEILQRSLPLNHPDLAMSYNNIGNVYFNMGEYSKALSYNEKTLAIRQQSLPPNHPDLAMSYNNIGLVYFNMSEYSKALSYNEKALEIRQQSLPPNHPDLAMSYINIGNVYFNMGEYSKALSYYEKSLAIRQQSLPPNHPDLAMSYNNIGFVYFNMGEYSKALSYNEKALEIRQQSLPPNHPDLAMSYNNTGLVYFNMSEYPKALSYNEKALEIRQQSLPPNHPDLAMSYNNIGNVYGNMGEYSKALSYYEKSLEIRQQSLPPNHPDLAMSYNNTGLVYFNMSEYPKALSSYEKALEIKQQSLPPNHPDLANSYNNIGNVYGNMGECSKALSYNEKALEIRQQSLPPNHPDLAMSYNNIALVYQNMGEYSKAQSFCERALDIGQQSLPQNHPHLQCYSNNLDKVKAKL
jgi:tetratricopeptide (TPR) repeat protein